MKLNLSNILIFLLFPLLFSCQKEGKKSVCEEPIKSLTNCNYKIWKMQWTKIYPEPYPLKIDNYCYAIFLSNNTYLTHSKIYSDTASPVISNWSFCYDNTAIDLNLTESIDCESITKLTPDTIITEGTRYQWNELSPFMSDTLVKYKFYYKFIVTLTAIK